MVETAANAGQSLTLWSLSAQDWGIFGRAERIAKRLSLASAEQIVLMHDGPMHSNRPDQLLQVLPEFLRRVTARWHCDALAASRRSVVQTITR
jgi:hypothetical protein